MRIHHLSCGTCCPIGGRRFDGTTDGPFGHLVCHCLLIESDAGLILVDTGFGTRDVDHPHRRLSEFFLTLNNIQLRPEETAVAQVRALGFDPRDVRRSEEHTSELQSLMRISYAVFCLKKKNNSIHIQDTTNDDILKEQNKTY